MFAVILAGGRGERLRPHTDSTLKPMLEVGGKPILEHQITQLTEAGVKDIVIVEKYKAKDVQNYFETGERFGVKIHHLALEKDLGTAGAVREGLKQIPQTQEEIPVLWGDILSNVDIQDVIKKHKETQPLVTMLTIKQTIPYGVVRKNAEGMILGFEQKPTIFANGAIFVLSKEISNLLPEEGDFSKDVLGKLAGKEAIRDYPFEGYWRHISTEGDLLKARKELEEGTIKDEVGRERNTGEKIA